MTHARQDSLTQMLHGDGEHIVERLDHWAATTPDRTFIHYGEDRITLTFGEFGSRTDDIAGNLAAAGIRKGDRISVFTQNPLVSTLVMFSAWKIGALYCPVNFNYRKQLLAYQLNDTAPRLLVTDVALLDAVIEVATDLSEAPPVAVYDPPPGAHDHSPGRPLTADGLETLTWGALTAPAPRPRHPVAAGDPANVIYTSGTTGSPKGVVQPLDWIAQYTFWLCAVLTRDDVIYTDLPMYHVAGAIANVARAAWVGCEVAMWDRFSPNDFWNRVASRNATTAILIDVMIPWLSALAPSADDRHNSMNKVLMLPLPGDHHDVARRWGIDFVMTGFGQTESGAPLSVIIDELAEDSGTPQELYRGYSHAQILDIAERYGAKVYSDATEVTHGIMGAPSPFMEVVVLDQDDRRCPPGTSGQLAVRPKLPHLMMAEYLGKPEATVAAWRNLWFHTGDAAVENPDGTFSFVDRLGDRIRVRGENLSSSQIEDHLNQHRAVSFSAVFPIRSAEGGEDDIVAFVVLDGGADMSEADLHAFAAETMPKYMRPRHMRIVADVPRTPTMKIEKYKLRQRILDELAQ